MKDNLPPLPPYAPEFKPRWATDPGGYNEEQMQAYARAAIERQSVPALTEDWIRRHSMLGADCAGASTVVLASSLRRLFAAAPQPLPVPPTDSMGIPECRGPLCAPNDHHPLCSHKPQPERQALQAEGKHPAPCARFCEATAFNIKIRGLGAQLKALAQPQPVQEPVGVVVATRWDDAGKTTRHEASFRASAAVNAGDMLYTTPQSAPQPLTVAGVAVFQDAEGKRPVTAIGQPVGRWEPTPLYPPGGAGVFFEKPQAQPLSDEQIADAYEAMSIQNHLTWAAYLAGARYAEAAHGIKGTT